MSRKYLVQTVVNTHNFVTDDTTVTDVFLVEAGVPVATTFCKAVAHHDDVFGGNGRFIHELEEALIIMIRINTWGGIDRSCNNIGYQRAQANHAVTVFGMHGIDEQDDGSIVVRIYDDGSTSVSGVPVGIRTKIISVIGSVGGEIIPS